MDDHVFCLQLHGQVPDSLPILALLKLSITHLNPVNEDAMVQYMADIQLAMSHHNYGAAWAALKTAEQVIISLHAQQSEVA